jgi:hypothetical protein
MLILTNRRKQKLGATLDPNFSLLPLKDLFRNQKIEINIDLSELKSLFEAFKLSQITTTTII